MSTWPQRVWMDSLELQVLTPSVLDLVNPVMNFRAVGDLGTNASQNQTKTKTNAKINIKTKTKPTPNLSQTQTKSQTNT